MKNKRLNMNNIICNRINIIEKLFEKKGTILLIKVLAFSLESINSISWNIVIFRCFKLARKNSAKKPFFLLVRLRGKKEKTFIIKFSKIFILYVFNFF